MITRAFARRRLLRGSGVLSIAALLGSLTGRTASASPPPSPSPRPTPADALAGLLAGNERFVSGTPHYGHDVANAAAKSGAQRPTAVVLGCIDSRVPLEAVFDQDFGAICVVRSGGVVLDRAVLGSVEFAVTELAVPLVMVLGHERCGAVQAAVNTLRGGPRPPGSLGYLIDAISPAVLEVGAHRPDAPERALRRHLARTVSQLEHSAGPVPELLRDGYVTVVGAVYDLDTGRVDLLD